jgi:hypothetical protein
MVTHPPQADTLQAAIADVASISDDDDDSYEPDDRQLPQRLGSGAITAPRRVRAVRETAMTIPAGTTREESGAASGMTRRETWAAASTALAGCAAVRGTLAARAEAACLAATRAWGATLQPTTTANINVTIGKGEMWCLLAADELNLFLCLQRSSGHAIRQVLFVKPCSR